MDIRRWKHWTGAAGLACLAFCLSTPAGAAAAAAKKKKKTAKKTINKDDGIMYIDKPFKLSFKPLRSTNGKAIPNPGWKGKDGYHVIKRKKTDEPYKLNFPLGSNVKIDFDWDGKKSYAKFDLNGDGKYKGKQESPTVNKNGAVGPLTFRTVYPKGGQALYSLYVYSPGTDEDSDWSRSLFVYRACYRSGAVKIKSAEGRTLSIPVSIYDDNNNGLFDDYGEDSVKIGSGKSAKWLLLSQIVMLGGQPYHMRVSDSGGLVYLKKFEGKTGMVDIGAGYEAKGGLKIGSLLVKSTGSTFDVAPSKKTKQARIPVGTYSIVGGYLLKGASKVRIHEGTMEGFEVSGDTPPEVKWGAPFKLVAKVQQDVRGIVVTEAGIYGSAGVYFSTEKAPPIVYIRKSSPKGKVVHREQMKYGKDGKLMAWWWDPKKHNQPGKGVYYVVIEVSSKSLGKMRSEPEKVAFKSLF